MPHCLGDLDCMCMNLVMGRIRSLGLNNISSYGALWVKNCCFRHRPIAIARPPSPVRCGFGVDRGRPARHRRRGRGRSLGHPQGHFLILRHGMSLGGLQRNIGRWLLPLQKFTLRMGCWIQLNETEIQWRLLIGLTFVYPIPLYTLFS